MGTVLSYAFLNVVDLYVTNMLACSIGFGGRMPISFANRSFVLCASSGRWNALAWNAVAVVQPSLFGRGVRKHLPCCSTGTKMKRTVLTIMFSFDGT